MLRYIMKRSSLLNGQENIGAGWFFYTIDGDAEEVERRLRKGFNVRENHGRHYLVGVEVIDGPLPVEKIKLESPKVGIKPNPVLITEKEELELNRKLKKLSSTEYGKIYEILGCIFWEDVNFTKVSEALFQFRETVRYEENDACARLCNRYRANFVAKVIRERLKKEESE